MEGAEGIGTDEDQLERVGDLLAHPRTAAQIIQEYTPEEFLQDLEWASHPSPVIRNAAKWRIQAFVRFRVYRQDMCTILDQPHNYRYYDGHDGHTKRNCTNEGCSKRETIVRPGEYPPQPRP
jgi:hypothetical protein